MSKQAVHTLDDIARLAKVSPSTVSRALNNSPLLSEETRLRIQAIAKKHDFSVNVSARNLRMRQSSTVAFVAPSYYPEFYSTEDLFGKEMLGSIGRALRGIGYDLLVVHANPDDTAWARPYLDSGRVDGFIIMASNRRQEHMRALVKLKAPFIAWGMPVAGFSYCSVTGDNAAGGFLATKHLLDRGRRSIAFLGGPQDEATVLSRLEGYERALGEAGLRAAPSALAFGDYSFASGENAMRRLLELSAPVDAVFANSDLMAIGAIKAIQGRGMRVPDDIAVVGYDDLPVAAYNNLPLTTVRQNFPLVGELLARNLVQHIQTGKVTSVVAPVELVVRDSA